jgi:hypothetical protein
MAPAVETMFLATAMGAARASARAGAGRSGPGRRVVARAGKGALARAGRADWGHESSGCGAGGSTGTKRQDANFAASDEDQKVKITICGVTLCVTP